MSIKISSLKKRKNFKKRLTPPTVGSATTFGNFGNLTSKWLGGGIAPNGNIYSTPFNATSVLKIDPIVGSASTIPIIGIGTQANYRGSVIGKNGKLYGIPSGRATDNNRVLEFDPENSSYKFFSEIINNEFFGGVLAPNGKIYGVPFQLVSTPSILEIDPVVGIATTFSSSVPAGRYAEGVLAPNGKIYCIPYFATTVLEIDPNTKTTSTFGTFSGGIKWVGGVLANNGKIYGFPFNTTSVLEIDPISRTVSTFGDLSDIWLITDPGWGTGVCGPDGYLYAFGKNSSVGSGSALGILKIDPINKTLSLVYSNIGETDLLDAGGTVIAPNGNIYTIPSDSPSVLSIGVSAANKSPDWVVEPYKNRPRVGIVTNFENVGVSTGGVYQYTSGCLANDGNIYCMPYGGLYNNSAKILKINPNKETYEYKVGIPDFLDAYYAWGPSIQSTIQLKNGKICGIPFARNKVIFYDPKSDTINETTIYNLKPVSGYERGEIIYTWNSACLAPNGKIYCPPESGNKILVIDPDTESTSIDDFSSVGISTSYYYGTRSNWNGSVLAPNGKIYAVPSGETSVLEIDPVAGTATTFGSLGTSDRKWFGAVLAPNGKIYGIPQTATTILEIDPTNRTVSTFGNISTFLSSGQNSLFTSLGADGKIYILPNNHKKIIQLDPETKTLSLYKELPENVSVSSGVLAPNGNLYGIPSGWVENFISTQATLISIGTTQSYAPANWMLSSYTNK
jgi:streptogramin lyase